MFNKAQLEFIQGSLTAQGTAIPAHNNGVAARVFVTVLDEIDAQLAALETAPLAARTGQTDSAKT